MDVKATLRDQLHTLRIPGESRPAAAVGSARGTWAVRAASVAGIVVLAASATVGLAWWRGWGGSGAVDVALFTVPAAGAAPAELAVLTATGKIVSDHRVQVVTKVSGQIVALHFEQGDRVAEGQLLAEIEDVNYRALRDQAAAMVEKSRAALAYHEANFARVEGLFREGRSSDIEFRDAQRWLDEARAQLAADRAALEFAAKALHDTRVVAPIAGVVLERNVEVGDFVAAEGGRGANANAQFATIADMSKLRVEVDVSELDVARIRRGMRCTVAPDAYKDRRYRGHVMWIDPGANYAKATVQAKVRIEEPDEFLRVEGSAQVQFLADAIPGGGAADDASTAGVWIPAAAVHAAGDLGAGRVMLVENQRVRSTPVQLGRRQGGLVEVVSGLTAGQRIVAEGVDRLADGQTVVGR